MIRAAARAVGGSVWRSTLLVFAGLFLLSGTWAVATPLSASPDEPAHIIKAAAVVRGELVGTPTGRAGYTRVTVPEDVAKAWSWTCEAFNPRRTAACIGPIPHGTAAPTEAVTSAGLYNPLYYVLVGWPTLLTSHSIASVLSMRLLTALLCSAFLAIAFGALFLLRRSLVTGFAGLAVLTPTTLFLSGAVNPNAVEISAGAALLALLLLLVRGESVAHPRTALVLVAVSGVVLANTRGLSPLWMAMIGAIAIVAAPGARLRELLRRPATWVTLAVLAAGAIAAVLWTAGTNTLANMGSFPGGSVGPKRAFLTMLLDRSFDGGLLGTFGWLDTPAPPFAYAVFSFLAMATVLAALVLARGRMLAALLVAIGGFFLIPATVQALSIAHSGYIWQARYSLVAYACVLVVAGVAIGMRLTEGAQPLSSPVRGATIAVGAVFVAAQAWTVAFVLRRYVVGINADWSEYVHRPQWASPIGNYAPILIGLAGAAAIGLAWILRSGSERAPLLTPRTADTSVSTGSPGYPAAGR